MKKLNLKYIIIAAIIAVVAFFVGRTSTPSVEHKDVHDHASMAGDAQKESVWTCSMHPQIKQAEPGQCPICGMDLIPLEDDLGGDSGPRVLELSENARALASIETSLVERRFPEAEIRMVGKIDYDETRLKSLTARFPARIDRLFVNYTGVRVNKDDHLAEIYSPQLLIAQKELLTAIKYDPDGAAAESSREKLRLWDLLPEQIEALEKSGKADDHMELKSPVGGVVVEKHVREGDYLKTGQSLFKIADLTKLWIHLDAYESDLAWLRYGQTVEFAVESYPGEKFTGLVVFIDPVLNRKTRTIKIRVDVNNKEGRLKPGMFVRAVVYSKVTSSGNVYAPEFAGKWICPMHPEIIRDEASPCPECGMDLARVEDMGYIQDEDATPPIVVPRSAVLRTGKRSVVYVAKPGTENPTYEGREVTLGSRAGDYYIIKEGLDEGDRVVTNGAFKIDSALQIQAKPSMMNPEGGGHDANEEKPIVVLDVPSAFKVDVDGLISHYFKLQLALADDDFATAKESAKAFVAASHDLDLTQLSLVSMRGYKEIHKAIHPYANGIAEAENIEDIREKYFKRLSLGVRRLISEIGTSGAQPVYQMFCSMAGPDGAGWLQNTEDLVNPYYGESMLHCGEVRGELVKEESHKEHEHHGK